MDEAAVDHLTMEKAWTNFINGLPVPPGVVRPEVLKSWEQSKTLGVDPLITTLPDALDEQQVRAMLAENHLLITCTNEILDNFYHLIKDADSVIMLLDRDLYLLSATGSEDRWKEWRRVANIRIGTCFQEKSIGTTAVGLAFEYDRPFATSGGDYYLKLFRSHRGIFVPIHNEAGEIIAGIGLAVNRKSPMQLSYALAFVCAISGLIERSMRLMNVIDQKVFFSKSLTASMASLEEGLIVVGVGDMIVHINPYVENMFNVELKDVRNQDIRKLIKTPLLIDAINNKTQLVDHEVVLYESVKRQRYLVSVNPILATNGKCLGLTLVFKEFKSIQTLLHRVAGHHAHYTFDDIWGESNEIREVVRIAKIVAPSGSNILITGESGTGKELIAQSIHNMGIGTVGPFIAINCAAFPAEMIESEIFGYEPGTFTGGLKQGKPGKLELAYGGTLFLDEVNCMSLDMQVKLLRVLEEKKFQRLGGHRNISLDARIISATNQDLRERLALGHFRSDLYYRLSVVEIRIPPLRLHKQDIEIYANRFIPEMNKRLGRTIQGCSQEAMDYLMSYSWPGNVRELKNWIERAVNLAGSDVLTVSDFPNPVHTEPMLSSNKTPVTAPTDNQATLSDSLGSIERDQIKLILKMYDGNTEHAARHLGIGRTTLYRKIKKYGLMSKEIH